jgi:RNA polymerase sigma factor (sigma-70 family)
MRTRAISDVLRQVRSALLSDGMHLSDAQLLEGFVNRQQPAALAVLVRRHAPMVWGVCRRILGDHHDAEDAFQATFLVLVRRAAAVRSPAQLGSWLYGVARQTAVKARAMRARRRSRENPMTSLREPAARDPDGSSDLRQLLELEVSRLPERYRIVLVLCDLEGRSGLDAAQRLGCPPGTVSSRLARARALLARRLARHGFTLSGAMLTVVGSQSLAAVPGTVVATTIASALASAAGEVALVPVRSHLLMEGVVQAMALNAVRSIMVRVGFLLLGVAALASAVIAAGPTLLPEAPLGQAADERTRPATPPAGKDQRPNTDEEKIQGVWQLVAAAENGQSGKPDGHVVTVTVRQGTLHFYMAEAGKPALLDGFYQYRLNATTQPRLIDVVDWKKGFEEGRIIEGVYTFDGDTLKLAFASGDFSDNHEPKRRPTSFETKEGSNVWVGTFRRQNKK